MKNEGQTYLVFVEFLLRVQAFCFRFLNFFLNKGGVILLRTGWIFEFGQYCVAAFLLSYMAAKREKNRSCQLCLLVKVIYIEVWCT